MKIKINILNGYFISIVIHLILILAVSYIHFSKFKETKNIVYLDFVEFHKSVTSNKKNQIKNIPDYKIQSYDTYSSLEELDLLSDTLEVIEYIKLENVKFNTHTMLSLRNLNSMYLQNQFRKIDSINHFKLNKEPPPSQAFNFNSFNKNSGKNYRSIDNFKQESFPGGGFGIPIIPVLKLLGIL